MGIKQYFRDTIVSAGLRLASYKDINVEAYKRNANSGGGVLTKKAPVPTRAVELRDWKTALSAAQNPENPNRIKLLDLYDSILLDAHLSSVVESRVLRVVRSKFVLRDINGEPNHEAQKLINKKWFEDFIRYAMWSQFRGPALVEVMERNELGELTKVNRVPERHVQTHKGIVVYEQTDEQGTSYRDGRLANYYLQIGADDDLGLLSNVAPMVVFKKNAISVWTEYIEKLGVPSRSVTTNTNDKKRLDELAAAMDEMISSSWIVLQGDETLNIHSSPGTDPSKVFDDLVSRLNSEISKRILGQDGTTDNKDASGTYGSLQVLQGVANDRHESDKVFVKTIINDYLIPMLLKQGGPYLALANHNFDWDNFNEMTSQQLIDSVSKLAPYYHLDVDQLSQKTGIPILGEKQQGMAAPFDENGEKKK
jgi:hypothetical protein